MIILSHYATHLSTPVHPQVLFTRLSVHSWILSTFEILSSQLLPHASKFFTLPLNPIHLSFPLFHHTKTTPAAPAKTPTTPILTSLILVPAPVACGNAVLPLPLGLTIPVPVRTDTDVAAELGSNFS